jgi:hypothetical protein
LARRSAAIVTGRGHSATQLSGLDTAAIAEHEHEVKNNIRIEATLKIYYRA